MASFGDQNFTPNSDPFTKTTEFETEFFTQIYNNLTGRKREYAEVPIRWEDRQNPDGTITRVVTETKPGWVDNIDENADRIMNDKGAKYLIRELRYIFNRHAAMGSLISDEAVAINASVIERIFIHIILNDIEYGVTNHDALLTEQNSLLNGVHLYLSSLKDGGIKEWSKNTLGITFNQSAQSDSTEGGGIGQAVKNVLNRK